MNVQIEGSTVEELLARVADEFGPEARIVAADRIRRGGVGGFFTRERYEMTVAVPSDGDAAPMNAVADDMLTRAVAEHDRQTQQLAAVMESEPRQLPRATAPRRSRVAASYEPAPQSRWESLVPDGLDGGELPDEQLVEDPMTQNPMTQNPMAQSPMAEHPLDNLAVGLSGSTRTQTRPTPAAPRQDAPRRTPKPADTPRGLLDLADAVSASERSRPKGSAGGDNPTLSDTFRTTAPPTVSTEDPGFAAVLTRLSASLAATPGSTVPDTPASLFAAPAEYEPMLDPQRPAALAPPEDMPIETRRRSSARALPAAAPAKPRKPRAAKRASELPEADRTEGRRPEPRGAAPRRSPVRRSVTAQPTLRLIAAQPVTRASATMASSLEELGLPAEYLPAAGSGDLLGRLAKSLQALPMPEPLPIMAGEVVVVVGEGTAALTIARQIAATMRLDDNAVHLAAANDLGTRMPAARLVTDRQRAARQRLVWATKSHPVVVALDAPLGPSAAETTAQLLRALSPSAIVAVAPATAKPSVLSGWLDRLPYTGAPLSLAVTDSEATSDPAAILGLGIPVETVDGRPSDPLTWATLLAGRLET